MNKDKVKMNFFQRIWYAFKVFLCKIWKKIEPDPILNPMQQDVFDIFEMYLNDDNNVRQLEPGTEKKFIVSKEYILNRNMDDLFIMLDSRKISLINGTNKQDYDNKSDLPEKTIKTMNEMFINKVVEDRQLMRNDINGNIKSSLEIIKSKLKNKNK